MARHFRQAYSFLRLYQNHHHTNHTRAANGSHDKTSFLSTVNLKIRYRDYIFTR